VTYQVYVLTAAILNALSVWVVYILIRELIPERRWLALGTGFLTAIWLYPPMGTPYPEQCGFIGTLVAVTVVAFGVKERAGVRRLWFVVAGGALAASALCKTNAGIFAVPCVFIAIALMSRRVLAAILMDWLSVGLGLLMVFGTFATWLWTVSDPTLFRNAVFETAGSEGVVRLFGSGWERSLVGLLAGKGNDLVRIGTLVCLGISTLGMFVARRMRGTDNPVSQRLRTLAVLALSLSLYQNLFSLSSSNNGTNEVPFVGLIWAFALEAVLRIRGMREQTGNQTKLEFHGPLIVLLLSALVTALCWPQTKNMDLLLGILVAGLLALQCGWFKTRGSVQGAGQGRETMPVLIVFAGLFVALAGLGITVGMQRQIQDVFNNKTQYTAQNMPPSLVGLKWATSVDPKEAHANWEEFSAVVAQLQSDEGSFLVIGDYTVLYGVVGRPSRGPLLWFHKGLTYSSQYDLALDKRLAETVEQPDVTQIVVEQICFMGAHQLEDFPLLSHSVAEHFRPALRFGIFQMYVRNAVSEGKER
jgi:hypothetical protein